MYSQYDEERFILEAVKDRECTRLLDIGAWNAVDFSNSRALIEQGWSGVLVEPSPGPMLGLMKEYGESERITLIQALVGTAPGLLQLHVSDDAVSTSFDAEYDRWKGNAKFLGKILVPVITLPDLANRYGGFEFVNIDAEGASVDLFLTMLQLDWQPTCVCVEHESREGEIIAAATAQHYSVVYGNGTNLVLVRK